MLTEKTTEELLGVRITLTGTVAVTGDGDGVRFFLASEDYRLLEVEGWTDDMVRGELATVKGMLTITENGEAVLFRTK